MSSKYGKFRSFKYPNMIRWALTIEHDDWNEAIPLEHEEETVDRIVTELQSLEAELTTARQRADDAEAALAAMTSKIYSALYDAEDTVTVGDFQQRLKPWLDGNYTLQAENERLRADLSNAMRHLSATNKYLSEILGHFKIDVNPKIMEMTRQVQVEVDEYFATTTPPAERTD